MRKEITIAAVLLAAVLPLSANDSTTATRFLRDYVGALKLTRAGDALVTTGGCDAAREQYSQARNLIDPYTVRDPKRQVEMEEAADLFVKALNIRSSCSAVVDTPRHAGPLVASAVKATWALANNPASVDKLWVGYRARRDAVRDLEQSFGPIASGPKPGQKDLEVAAASLAVVLAHPPQEVFKAQPRVLGNVYH